MASIKIATQLSILINNRLKTNTKDNIKDIAELINKEIHIDDIMLNIECLRDEEPDVHSDLLFFSSDCTCHPDSFLDTFKAE